VLDLDLFLHRRLDLIHSGEVAEKGLDLDYAQTDGLFTSLIVGKVVELGAMAILKKEGCIVFVLDGSQGLLPSGGGIKRVE